MRTAESDQPVGLDEFARLMAPAAAAPRIALAVSGGADSLALLHLAAGWRRSLAVPPDVYVLTVDHRLRPGAADEAAAVGAVAAGHGLPHEILVWDGSKPETGIEAAARAARYRLLFAAVGRIGASHLVVAHHREDQAETFLLRLARGSGVYGLGAMRPAVAADGVTILRPFLSVPKARLEATVQAAGLRPADDESNRDPRFARARLRRLMPLLEAEGLGAAELAAAAGRLARAGDALDRITGRLIAAAAHVDEWAVVTVDWPAVAAEPDEIRLRLLQRLVMALTGAPARMARLEALLAGLDRGGDRKQTLGGVVLARSGASLCAWREWGRAGLPVLQPQGPVDTVWDSRFRLCLAAAGYDGLTIAGLGDAARRFVDPGTAPARRDAARALPALFRDGEPVAVPALGIAAGGLHFRAEGLVAARLAEPRRFPDPGGIAGPRDSS